MVSLKGLFLILSMFIISASYSADSQLGTRSGTQSGAPECNHNNVDDVPDCTDTNSNGSQ